MHVKNGSFHGGGRISLNIIDILSLLSILGCLQRRGPGAESEAR
jgi:hypothetical protein